MVRDVGSDYLDLKTNLDDIRSDLGLGSYTLKGESLKEVEDILEGTLFKDRLEKIKKYEKQDK